MFLPRSTTGTKKLKYLKKKRIGIYTYNCVIRKEKYKFIRTHLLHLFWNEWIIHLVNLTLNSIEEYRKITRSNIYWNILFKTISLFILIKIKITETTSFYQHSVIRNSIKGQVLRRNRQLSSPLLSTRNTVTFSTLLLIAFLLSYLCTSFNLPNIFRLSCCPCPSPKPPRALFSPILSFLLVFLRLTTKTKGENTYIHTHIYSVLSLLEET